MSAATTDRDYADMVNPHVRAEDEAYKRGVQSGILIACIAFFIILVGVAAAVYS